SNVLATATSLGDFNTSVIDQHNINNSSANIYQAASGSDATIDQSGTWNSRGRHGGSMSDGNNQNASISQNWGWGNTAWVTQTGDNVNATITQGGYGNDGGIIQHGTGRAGLVAVLTQSGHSNDGYIQQKGSDLTAYVSQTGIG